MIRNSGVGNSNKRALLGGREANFCANTVQHRLNAAQPAVHANAESTKHFPPFERDFPSNGGGEGEPLPPETISASCCSPELS